MTYIIDNGIIDLSYVQEKMEMDRKKRIILEHPYSIWRGKNGKWYTYVVEDGRRTLKKRTTEEAIHNVIVDNFDKNQEKEQEKKQEIKSYTFKNAYNRWVEVQTSYEVANNTLYKYEYDFKRYFEGSAFLEKDIKDITTIDIELLIIQNIKKHKLKEKAGKALWGYISGTFKCAIIDRKLVAGENPCSYVDTKKFKKFYNTEIKSVAERTINEEQVQMLLQQINEDHLKKPDYMPTYAIELAMLSGMRTGELAGLRWENIYLDKGYIDICVSEKFDIKNNKYYISDTKNKKDRIFPITMEIAELLNKIKAVQEMFGSFQGFVFSNQKGHCHGRTIGDCIRNKCIQVGITDTKCIYSIRRTFNSQMKCDGVSTTVAASLLGHTEEVNENNYTYDVSELSYKREVIENAGKRMIHAS